MSSEIQIYCDICQKVISSEYLCDHFKTVSEDMMETSAECENTDPSELCTESDQSIVNTQDASFEELLICCVQEKPALWDSKLPLSEQGKTVKDQCWQDIFNIFGGRYTLDTLQKKWRNLRDTYVRVKGEYEVYVSSGSAAKKKKKPWKHYEALQFLSDSLKPRCTTSNVSSDETSASSACSVKFTHEESTPKTSRNSKKNIADAVLEAIKNIPPPPMPVNNYKSADVNPIAVRISQLLDQLPENRKALTEIKLLQFMYNELYEQPNI